MLQKTSPFSFSLSSTQHKLALFMSALCGVLLLLTTTISIWLISQEIQHRTQTTLQTALDTVAHDYQTTNTLQEQRAGFQMRNLVSSFDRSYEVSKSYDSAPMETASLETTESRRAPLQQNSAPADTTTQQLLFTNTNQISNINQTKTISLNETTTKSKESAAALDEVFTALTQQPQVYTRVIASNGDILFSSDLFNTLNLDPHAIGFVTIERQGVCVHALTARLTDPVHQGTVVQVGQYCSLPQSAQQQLFFNLSVVTFLLMVVAYVVSLFVASLLLQPLTKAAERTKQFAQNCYHELLTPLSVALSTAEAAIRQKTYESGLSSVTNDLKSMKQVVDTLGQHATVLEQQQQGVKVNFSAIVKDQLEQHVAAIRSVGLKVHAHLEPEVLVNFDAAAIKIIVRNLLQNAVQHASARSTLSVELTKKEFRITNELNKEQFDEQGILDTRKVWQRGYTSNLSTQNGLKELGKETNKRMYPTHKVTDTHVQNHGIGLHLVKDLCQTAGWKVQLFLKNSKDKKDKLLVVVVIDFHSSLRDQVQTNRLVRT